MNENKNGDLNQLPTKEQLIEAVWIQEGLIHMDNYKKACLKVLELYDTQIAAQITQAFPQPQELEQGVKNYSKDKQSQKAFREGAAWFAEKLGKALQTV